MMRNGFTGLAAAAVVLMLTANAGAQAQTQPPPKPKPPAPAPAQGAPGERQPKPQPATQTAQAPAKAASVTLGSVKIPKGVSANGQPLPAGTYTVRLASTDGVPGKVGQTPDLSKWCEFVQGGAVKGKELCTVLSSSEVGAVVKDSPPPSGGSKVQMLKGNDYLRVWINRGGTHYLMHLPASAGL
jgi:glucose/arabinose dehydrogenase